MQGCRAPQRPASSRSRMCTSDSNFCICACRPVPGFPIAAASGSWPAWCTDTSIREKHQMARNTSVIGIYEDPTTVSGAISVLHNAGYRTTDISVLSSDNRGSKDFAHEEHSKAPNGAAVGRSGSGRGGWRRSGLLRFH